VLKKETQLTRRNFLKQSAALGIGAAVGPYLRGNAFGASRDRITIYQNTGADSSNPYNQSSGSIYGNWQHVIEPLVELDYAKKAWVGVLAESWEFQGKRWVFKLKKGIKFHNGAPLTSKDVAFSVEKIYQDHGIGTELMGRVVRAARNRGIRRLYMSCLAENGRMQAIARKHDADLKFELGEVIGEIVPETADYISVMSEAAEDRVAFIIAVLELHHRLVRAA